GWFVLEMRLWYEQTLIATGLSDPFVFNNPRMRKPKEFSSLSCQEVNFIQLYSASSTSTEAPHNEDYWLQVGLQLNFELDRVMELISLANRALDSWKRKSSSRRFHGCSGSHSSAEGTVSDGHPHLVSLSSGPREAYYCVVLYQWVTPCG